MSKIYKYKNAIIKLAKELGLGTKKVKVLGRQALALYDPLEEPVVKITLEDIMNEIKKTNTRLDSFEKEVNNKFDNVFDILERNNIN